MLSSHIAKFVRQTWGPPGSCRPQMGPMFSPWTLPLGYFIIGICVLNRHHNIESRQLWCVRTDFFHLLLPLISVNGPFPQNGYFYQLSHGTLPSTLVWWLYCNGERDPIVLSVYHRRIPGMWRCHWCLHKVFTLWYSIHHKCILLVIENTNCPIRTGM